MRAAIPAASMAFLSCVCSLSFAATSAPTANRWGHLVGKMLAQALGREVAAEGGTVGATTSAQFAAYINDERSHWSRLVAESGVSTRQ